MIIEYDETGRIFHIVMDPVNPQVRDFMIRENKAFLDLPPVPWPKEPQFDEDGKPLLDENGKQIRMSNGVTPALVDIADDYVVNGSVRARPDCPGSVAINGSIVRLEGFPAECNFTLHFDNVSVDTNETEIEFDEPGPVSINVSPPWPYKEAVYHVEIK